jgi:plastocyanin
VITTTATLPAGVAGAAYEQRLLATGGTGTFVWTVSDGALPAGLTLGADGVVRGIPVVAESRTFSVRATSGGASGSATLTLAIAWPPLRVLTTSLPPAVLGSSYAHFLDAEPGDGAPAWAVTAGALPAGVVLTSGGMLAGTPAAVGAFPFRVRVTRGDRAGDQELTLSVNAPPLVITTTVLPAASTGQPYLAQLEHTGGTGAPVWSVSSGRLPRGLSLSAPGLISGTPDSVESATFTVEATSASQRTSRTLTLSVTSGELPLQAFVDMPGDFFTPLIVELRAGGSVTWRFGSRVHNVIFAAAAGAPADIQLTSNVNVTRVFPVAGSFRYDCTIHPGMAGRVEVR